jgi:L-threonylcarbamoyladenylate synthase
MCVFCCTFAVKMENRYDKQDLQQALRVLREGGVILYPTDTVWGIGCDATNAAAVARVYEIKRRVDSKAMLVLLDGAGKLQGYMQQVPETAWMLLEAAEGQRPLTIIYPNARNLAPNLLAEDGSVGIRITSEPFSKALCEQLRRPIISTSANFSGEPAAKIFSEINPELLDAVDYVCAFRREDTTRQLPSSIIKIDERERITIIRP